MPDTLPHRGGNQDYDPETDAPKEDEWDRQIEEDARAGRLDELAERARKQARAGRTTDLHGNPVDDPEAQSQ